jgi:CheY-like chemotaxis protein/HPt (histidine-containing phosphotransfer) domain-containing protein
MFEVLAGLFLGERAPEGPGEPEPPPGRAMAEQLPLRILLAEDNTVNQKVMLRLLAQMGYRADIAANGSEALQAVERQEYDLILMDVQMPEMDGLEASRRLCARWRRDERPRIIAMTANAMQGDREICLNAGMDDYVSKPIRMEELAAALRRYEPRPRAAAASAIRAEQPPRLMERQEEIAAPAAAPRNPDAAGGRAVESGGPVLDSAAIASLRELVGEKMLPDFIDTFIDDSRALLADLERAVAEADAPLLHRTAHTLKSHGAILGATALAASCTQLEEIGKASGPRPPGAAPADEGLADDVGAGGGGAAAPGPPGGWESAMDLAGCVAFEWALVETALRQVSTESTAA